MLHKIFKGPNGLRAGWRLVIYSALVFTFGYGANKIADAALHGRQPDPSSPTVGIVTFSVALCLLLVAAWIMSRIEGRNLGDYGFPWRRAFCGQFWQASGISFVSLTLLLAILRLADAYSLGRLQLHGVDILKYGLLWAATMILATMVEEFLYRGYLQFTLTSGIGFWPAAVITSALMAAAHMFNPGWTVLGLFTVGGFGLIACLLLRRTGDLWMPLGLHVAWDWGETYFYGVPDSGQMGHGHLVSGEFSRPGVADGDAVRGGSRLAECGAVSTVVAFVRAVAARSEVSEVQRARGEDPMKGLTRVIFACAIFGLVGGGNLCGDRRGIRARRAGNFSAAAAVARGYTAGAD